MAKDFTTTAASTPVTPLGSTSAPAQTAQRGWQSSQPSGGPARPAPLAGDRGAAVLAALQEPTFVQEIGRILKERKEADADPEAFVAHALRQVRASNSDPQSKLADCAPRSVQAAVKKLAVLGLVPNAEQGEGWLLARWNNKLRVYQAVPVPGVRGMERKLMETGAVANIESRAIYLQDHCKVRLGTENVIEHEVNFAPDPAQPNPIVGAYGVVTLKDGRREIAVRRHPPAPAPGRPSPNHGPAPVDEAQESGQKAVGFMSEEDRVRYSAQRLAMKGALHKFFVENRELQEVLALERASYESAVNPEARAGVPLKVDPQTQQLEVPKAEVDELTETPGVAPAPVHTAQGPETAERPTATRRRVAAPTATQPTAKPASGRHPVDELTDQIRQRYRPPEGPGEEASVSRGVRL